MWKKSKKKEIDEELLEAIAKTKKDWQKYQFIVEVSVEPDEELIYREKLSQAKFLFLLRQARERNVCAIRLT